MISISAFIGRLILCAVFGVAGAAKLMDLPGSRAGVEGFGVPKALVPAAGVALPLVELMVAVSLWPPRIAPWGALGALGLLLLFIVGIGYNLNRGRAPDCHCFGQIYSEPAGWKTLIRNVVLAAVALAVLLMERADSAALGFNPLGTWSGPETLYAALAVVIIALLAYQTWLLRRQLEGQRTLLALLGEVRGGAAAVHGSETHSDGATEPLGLPVGAPAPQFALPDGAGRSITLASLLAEGLPILLAFTDPHCNPCKALMPDLVQWQREYSDALRIVLLSHVGSEEAREAYGPHGLSTVLFQQAGEVAEAYRVRGTPGAVLIYPNGIIASPVALGSDMIRGLLHQYLDLSGAPVVEEIDPALILEQLGKTS